ncbi:MAG: TRAP transporter small permease [Dehalococcoidales bacterium]
MKFTARLGKFERFNHRLSGWLEWVGIAGLLLMVLATVIDVVGAKLFNWRLLGAIDIVMLSQIIAISFAAATTLLVGRHVSVEFFVSILPRLARTIIEVFVSFLGLSLFSLIIWRLIVLGYSYQSSGEATATVYIPLYFFAYAIAFACIPIALIYLVELGKSLTKVRGK